MIDYLKKKVKYASSRLRIFEAAKDGLLAAIFYIQEKGLEDSFPYYIHSIEEDPLYGSDFILLFRRRGSEGYEDSYHYCITIVDDNFYFGRCECYFELGPSFSFSTEGDPILTSISIRVLILSAIDYIMKENK